MLTVSANQSSAADVQKQWAQDIRKLTDQVSEWMLQEPDWIVEASSVSLSEESLGTYTVPVLTVNTPSGRLVLEPIARNYPGRGIVELYAWPTLFRVRLLHDSRDSNWRVRVDSGFTLHQDWNRQNFIILAKDLLGAS